MVDTDAANIVVRIILEKAGTKSLSLPTGSITILNASEELQLTYEVLAVELAFAGKSEDLEEVSADTVIAAINLADCNEEGSYTVPVKVTKAPDGCKYMEEVQVKIVLTKKEEKLLWYQKK